MKTDWNKIEQEFIEWDNEGHSNASQRQILDWFKEKFKPIEIPSDEEIEKQYPLGVIRKNESFAEKISRWKIDAKNELRQEGAKWLKSKIQ